MKPEGELDQSIPEIWFEAVDPRRLGVLFRRIAALFLFVVAVAASLMTLVLSSRIAEGERFEDRRLVAAIAAADPATRAELIASSGREAIIVDLPTEDVRLSEYPYTVIVSRVVPDDRTQSWLRAVAVRAAGEQAEWFESRDGADEDWWHTTAQISDDQMLVIHRPRSQALAAARALRLWVFGVGAIVVAGLFGVWLVLRQRVQKSTNIVMEAVEDLRVRGEIRGTTRRRLDRLPDRPIELKRLAQAVADIEVEIRGAFNEIDSLLQGAEALGGSLDPNAVIKTSLEHLESLLGADRSAIVSMDHRRRASTVLAVHGHDEPFFEELARRPYDLSMPSVRASREQSPVQVSDTESDFVAPELRQRAKRFGYRSLLAVPLPPILESPTVLLLHKPEPYSYSHYEIELSVSFASIVAAALRNAELFAQTDQSLSEQSSRLTAIVDSVDDGLLVESSDGVLIYANGVVTGLGEAARSGAAIMPGQTRSSELLNAILSRASDPITAGEALDRVRSSGDAWCELELRSSGEQRSSGELRSSDESKSTEGSPTTWRVRSFTVTDAREARIGRGLVWTDVTADRELDRMKSGLLATVSHEFRTPLALIKGYATTLLADDVQWADAERFEFLELMANEADRLTDLVQRLLDMRRIDAGLVDLQMVSIELDSIIHAAVKGTGNQSYRIEVGSIPELLVMADETRLVTALRNLLENACKYSPEGSPVSVEVALALEDAGETVRGNEVEIRVCDRGSGIAEEDRSRIFDMFVRADHRLDAVHGGTGLGLAIAKGFVAAHRGRLWVEERSGGGSVFAMAIPLTIDELPDRIGTLEVPAS